MYFLFSIHRTTGVPFSGRFRGMYGLTLSKAELSLPKEANLYNSIQCGECGELVSEHRMKEKDGEKVCIPCFNKE